ncbi:unnamed protein product, partial [Amoebophrya sp. A25]
PPPPFEIDWGHVLMQGGFVTLKRVKEVVADRFAELKLKSDGKLFPGLTLEDIEPDDVLLNRPDPATVELWIAGMSGKKKTPIDNDIKFRELFSIETVRNKVKRVHFVEEPWGAELVDLAFDLHILDEHRLAAQAAGLEAPESMTKKGKKANST